MVPRRIILRIEVSPETHDRMPKVVEMFGSTSVAVTSRIVEWFVAQPDDIQARILGLYPSLPDQPDLATTILKQIVSNDVAQKMRRDK